MAEELYRAVPAPVTVPAPGSLGEAVNVFFDRAERCLPTYVGRMQALIVSIVVSLILVLLLTPTILDLKSKAETTQDQLQWIGVSLMTLLIAMMAQSRIADIVYNSTMYRHNKQHFANTHWLREYMTAYRPGML